MSKFTTELRFVCEELNHLDESKGYNNIDTIITNAAPQIFSFDYPIFDETYKPLLEKKIIRHYYTRELSEETYGLWKLRLEARMNEIMPYYNQLYSSQLLQFNPLYDTDLTRDHNKQFAGSSEVDDSVNHMGNSSGTNQYAANGTNWRLYSDTPQGGIEGIEGTRTPAGSGTVNDNTYLTDATKVTNADTASNNTTNNTSDTTVTDTNTSVANVEDYLEHIVGKSGTHSYSKMLMEFRKTFLNIDMMIIDDLSDLFFGLWW